MVLRISFEGKGLYLLDRIGQILFGEAYRGYRQSTLIAGLITMRDITVRAREEDFLFYREKAKHNRVNHLLDDGAGGQQTSPYSGAIQIYPLSMCDTDSLEADQTPWHPSIKRKSESIQIPRDYREGPYEVFIGGTAEALCEELRKRFGNETLDPRLDIVLSTLKLSNALAELESGGEFFYKKRGSVKPVKFFLGIS